MREYKRLYNIIIIVLVCLSIVPLFYISKYNHPALDDYSYSRECYEVWKSSRSLVDVIVQGFKTDIRYWNSWQGLYTSAFVLAICPSVFGESHYWFGAVFLLLVFSLATMFTSWFIFSKKLHQPAGVSLAIGALVLAESVQFMPSITEGIYWYNGAMNYTFPYVILLIFLCILIGMVKKPNKMPGRCGMIILASAVAFVLEGGNHITAFMGELLLLGFLTWLIINKKYNRIIDYIIVEVVLVAGMLLNFLAPGTAKRQSLYDNTGVIKTIFTTPFLIIRKAGTWTNLSLLIMLILLIPVVIPLCKKIIEEYDFKFSHPWLILILSWGWLSAMICPPYYVLGSLGGERIHNIVFFCFVWLVLLNYIYFGGWIMRRITYKDYVIRKNENIKVWAAIIIVALLAVTGVYEDSYGYIACQELTTGIAKQYSDQAYVRYELYRNPPDTNLIVDEYTTKSELLFFNDITTDETNWRNVRVARYFGLDSVKLRQ